MNRNKKITEQNTEEHAGTLCSHLESMEKRRKSGKGRARAIIRNVRTEMKVASSTGNTYDAVRRMDVHG